MSINTSNLITTKIGQVELSKVHSMNMRLKADHRSISVELLFPYLAISNKDMQTVSELEAETDSEIKSELCWTNVDICQVVNYSVGDEAKRNFTIGGLFNVESDITGAKSFLLFFKTNIVDFRSEKEKKADGGASAEHLLYIRYGYSVTQAPFAFTMILNNAGEMPIDGINIGASKFGRSRHRFYFNYIIDNNSGIADNITVNDNRYPYSDGYLSKTAFEDGLKRYEDAIAQYQTEYEKYANGHKDRYNNVESAIKYSENGNRFVINKFETDSANFDVIDMQAARDGVWDEWNPDDVELKSPSYKGYAARTYGKPIPGEDGDRYKECGAEVFEFKDVRPVEIVGVRNVGGEIVETSETKYLPIRFKFMMFNRSPLPFSQVTSPSAKFGADSLYHAVRCAVTIKEKDASSGDWNVVFDSAFEMLGYANDNLAIYPICPSIGRIKLKTDFSASQWPEKELTLSMLTQDIVIDEVTTDQDFTFKSNPTFKLITHLVTERSKITNVENVRQFNCLSYYYKILNREPVSTGYMLALYEPNFAGGYSFSESTLQLNRYATKVYTFGKLFDCEKMKLDGVNPTYSVMDVMKQNYITNSIVSDFPVTKAWPNNLPYSGLNCLLSKEEKAAISKSFYNETPTFLSLTNKARVICDNRLHNARVYVIGYDINGSTNVIDASFANTIEVLAFINNKTYKVTSSFGELFLNNLSSEQISLLTTLNVLSVSATPDGELNVLWEAKYAVVSENSKYSYVSQRFTTGTATNVMQRYVSIKDIDGSTNVITETVG